MKNGRYKTIAIWTEKTAAGVILILVLLFMLFLAVSAMTGTADLQIEPVHGERIAFTTDNMFLNILVMVLCVLAMYLFYKHCGELRLKNMERVLIGCGFLFGTAFILSLKLCSPSFSDSFIVSYAAQRAAVGDYSMLGESYFLRFPFQLGYVLYSELFFRLMGLIFRGFPEGYFCLALQEVNLLWMLFAYVSLIRICEYLSNDIRVQKLTVLLLFFCLPPLMSCTFLYGNIPAFGCGAGAVWMFTAFLKSGKLSRAILCAVLLTLAVLLKLNLLIFLAAIAVIWLLEIIRKPSLKSLLCLVLTAACVLSARGLPQKLYEERTGMEYGEGIPMLAWMAMGFSDGYAAPGWYKEDNTVTAFEESGHDPAAVTANARQVLDERIQYFRAEPGAAVNFFSDKLRSQWNEPSYQSLWVNQVFGSYSEKGVLYRILCVTGEPVVREYMNQYQQLVYAGMLLGCIALWKKKRTGVLLLPLIILGGLLYHLLFEAKSQYALPYFIMMIPVAACGFAGLFKKVDER